MSYQQINVYRCKCDKCHHTWITKTDVLPNRCAKCNVTTWNNGIVISDDKPKVAETIKQAIKMPVMRLDDPEKVDNNTDISYDFTDFDTP